MIADWLHIKKAVVERTLHPAHMSREPFPHSTNSERSLHEVEEQPDTAF